MWKMLGRCLCSIYCLIICILVIVPPVVIPPVVRMMVPRSPADNGPTTVARSQAVVPNLADRISDFRNLQDTYESQHDNIKTSIKEEMWDAWAQEELRKVLLINDEARPLFGTFLDAIQPWYEGWRTFNTTMSTLSADTQAILDGDNTIGSRIVHFLIGLYFGHLVDPERLLRQDEAVCQLARKEVELIANLSIELELLPMLSRLYSVLDRMHQVMGRISTSTGAAEWQQNTPGSCLAQNKTVHECGTEEQKRRIGLVERNLVRAMNAVKADYMYVEHLYDRLGFACRRVQRVEVRGCSFEIRCTDAPPNPVNISWLAPQEMLGFYQRTIDNLLQ